MTTTPGAKARRRTPPPGQKPAAEPPSAGIGYQPAGHDRYWHPVREAYHVVARRRITIDGHPVLKDIRRYPSMPNSKGGDPAWGGITSQPGEALCGNAGPWTDIPDGLFPPLISCKPCKAIADHAGITIGDAP